MMSDGEKLVAIGWWLAVRAAIVGSVVMFFKFGGVILRAAF